MDTRDGSLGVGSDDLPVGGVVEGPVGSALERGVGLGSTAPLRDDPITSNTSNSATGPTIPTVDSTDHSDSNPTSNPTTTTPTSPDPSNHSTTTSTTEPTSDPDRTLRVSQLDAEELDDGLVGMLLGKLGVGLEGVLPSNASTYHPELTLFLKIILYALAVRGTNGGGIGLGGNGRDGDRATPGMRLQNLRFGLRESFLTRRLPSLSYSSTPYLLFPLLTSLPTYLYTKLHTHSLQARYPEYPRKSWERRWWVLLERLGVGGKVWEGVGGLWFLVDARYPTLSARLLGIRLIPSQPLGEVTRSISYEYMNRQLVWSGFTELLIFLLPLIRGHSASISAVTTSLRTNIHKSLRFLLSKQEETVYEPIRTGSSGSPGRSTTSPGGSGQEGKRARSRKGTYADLPRRTCAICHHRLRDTLDGRLGLPAIRLVAPGSGAGAGGSAALARLTGDEVDVIEDDEEEQADNEETRIHLPAKTDCEDECRYCFYCISEVLTRRAKEVELESKRRGGGVEDEDDTAPGRGKMKGWECLRCGEEVWGCIRITT